MNSILFTQYRRLSNMIEPIKDKIIALAEQQQEIFKECHPKCDELSSFHWSRADYFVVNEYGAIECWKSNIHEANEHLNTMDLHPFILRGDINAYRACITDYYSTKVKVDDQRKKEAIQSEIAMLQNRLIELKSQV